MDIYMDLSIIIHFFNPNVLEEEGRLHSWSLPIYPIYRPRLALEPYDIWVRKEPGATSEELYRGIEDNKLEISGLQDTSQEIILKKNDPMLQGMNGGLTLGFIISMLVSTIGFLIYWILSIRSRELQFGIFRAMGLARSGIIGMLFWEQILTSGVAILMGITIGGVASKLYVPFLQIIYSSAEQVPPFKVVAYAGDYMKVYVVVTIMLVGAL